LRFGAGLAALLAATLVLGSAQAMPRTPTAPRRIVSLNPCLDAILLDVADPGQITALSHYSREPTQSVIWKQARQHPTWC
jgi:iron complex transport system substrate-binding protein